MTALPKGHKNQCFSIEHKMPDMMGGLDYAEELAGSHGRHFHFFAVPGTHIDTITKAARIAQAERDLVSWSYSYDAAATDLQRTPESAPVGNEPAAIVTCRKVKAESQEQRFYWTYQDKRKSLMIDSFSVGMVMAVWDKLKPEQRERLRAKGWYEGPLVIDFCMKLYAIVTFADVST